MPLTGIDVLQAWQSSCRSIVKLSYTRAFYVMSAATRSTEYTPLMRESWRMTLFS
jgi:hypothetical protein